MTVLGTWLRGRSARQIGPFWSWVMLGSIFVFLVFFFFIPVLGILSESIFEPNLTLANYETLVAHPVFLRVLVRTVEISLTVAGLCVVLGFPVAFLMARSSKTVATIVAACVLVPLWTSVLVRSYAWIIILQRNGLINEWLGSLGLIAGPVPMIYTNGAVILAMVQVLLPFVVLPLFGSLRGIPDDLYKAASVSGAGAWSTIRHVVVPLSLPGVSAGFALVFIQALGFYVTPALVGGPRNMMVSTLIGSEIRDGTSWGTACALAALLLFVTLILMFIFNRALRVERIAVQH